MSNRIRSNQLRCRSIVNDSAIHSLFSQLTDAHALVLQRISKLEAERSKTFFEQKIVIFAKIFLLQIFLPAKILDALKLFLGYFIVRFVENI